MNAPVPTRPAALPDEASAHAESEASQAREAQLVAIKKVAARARAVWSNGAIDADSVPSPCISLCRVDARTHWCYGCLRTLAEISAWSRLDGDAKRGVWRIIEQRAALSQAALNAPRGKAP